MCELPKSLNRLDPASWIRTPDGWYRCLALSFEWLDHGFGTRWSQDHLPEPSIAWLEQRHSDRVILVRQPGCAGEGDALITDRPGLALVVRTADCLPILLVDPVRQVVGAVHAGWRGTRAGITARAVEYMYHKFGSNPACLWVAVGPAIGRCCYEVGPEVALAFEAYPNAIEQRLGKTFLDLVEVNRQQLTGLGVPSTRIHVASLCTACHPDEFHSYRRQRRHTGSMPSFVSIRTPGKQ